MDYVGIAKKYRDEYYETLKKLVNIKSIRDEATATKNAPFGKGCRQALDFMLDLAKKDGFNTIDYDGYCGVIEYGEGSESIGILAHLDTVTLGDGWNYDPLGCELKDGYLFGRGVLDDKGPALCGYYVLKIMRDLGIKPKRKIMLILGCDEESGMECMEYYLKHGEIPTLGFTPDADFPVIYAESGMLGFDIVGKIADNPIAEMEGGERSNIVLAKSVAKMNTISENQISEFDYYLATHDVTGFVEGNTLTMEGKAAHAMETYKGVNAGVNFLNYVGASYHNETCEKLYNLLKDWRGSGFGIDVNGAYMGFLTMNPGIMSIKDDEIRITVDIRYPNDVTADELIKNIEDHLHAVLPEFKLENIDTSHQPLFVDPNSEFIQVLLEAYQSITKDTKNPPLAIRGGTYAKCFKNFVAFGPERPNEEPAPADLHVGGIHQANEAVKLDDLIEAIGIYLKAVIDLQDVQV